MARRPRLDLPGVARHVVQRGNNRCACFGAHGDYRLYLSCLRKASRRCLCQVHAYVLMTNHVHLLVTPLASGAVSHMMQEVGRRYVRIFNEIHQRTGTLWEGRFKASLIDSDSYLFTCHRYIELNPVRAGMVDDPGAYPWSSHRHYAHGVPDPLVTEHGRFIALAPDAPERRAQFRAMFQDSLAQEELAKIRAFTKTGWALGSERFVNEIERILGRSVRPPRRGRPLKSGKTAEDTGERTASEMLI
ncbi:MAG: hypothetical protein A3D95_04645 [Betaproteobacteria bacterium RIFCSPHIGHO2_12_FULL_69_13]|nr:MAG: hypothetical protein A3D95_04645 [Betaproteobacteria bacterium RIFCSPHIGHO2_12_FULL_69_13]OGA66213.1 MAG: hypothetical protein A3G83_12015 [Betaproteobacteria bacterium RIFCSPLOWO2_12_FULL_68_20]